MAKEWPKKIRVGHATVTVYRNKHHGTSTGWIFVVAWQSPHGRRREKFADEAEAIGEARLKATQLSTGRVEGAAMTTGDRDELSAARKLAHPMPVLAALQEWANARELTGGNIVPAAEAWAARNGKVSVRKKVRDVVSEFKRAKTAAGKNVADDHASTFDRIDSDLGEFFVDSVSAKQIDAWLAQWDNPVTRNTRRKRIVSIWRWAQRKGYLPRDARTEAEMTDVAHEPAPEVGIINVATWRQLLAYFRKNHIELVPALVLAGFCGLRRSEVHGQVWEDINLERKHLRVTKAKRGTPARRLVPLCDAAIEWLILCKHRKGSVCPIVEGRNGKQPSLAIDGIRRIARDAELPTLPDNAFRHSYISHRAAETGDIPRTAMDSGTSVAKVNRNYRELVSESEGKDWCQSFPTRTAEVIGFKEAANA